LNSGRLDEIYTALLEKRIELSLATVELAISRWRAGSGSVVEAHAEAVKHVARTTKLSQRIMRAADEVSAPLLRDAHDLGIIDAATFRTLTGKDPGDVAPPPTLDEELAGARAQKPVVIEDLLSKGAVLVHVDARAEGVIVPANHRSDPGLILRLGYGLTPPIPDLAFDADKITATLTFGGVPFHCVLPWKSVFALVGEDNRGAVWQEDMPPEVAARWAAAREGKKQEPEPEPPKPKGRGGHLKLV
jgi:stringent starvation protein B